MPGLRRPALDRLTRAATVRNPVARAARNLGFRLVGRVPLVQRRFAMNLSELTVAGGERAGLLTSSAGGGRAAR